MRYGKLALTAVGALVLLAGTRQASAVTLANLISSGGTLTSGGVIYSDFDVGGSMDPTKVNVKVTKNGLQFTAKWNTLETNMSNITIEYTATVDPNKSAELTDASLFMGGHTIRGGGIATVNETLTDLATQNAYNMNLFYDGRGGLTDSLKDTVAFNPAITSLRVIKSIDVSAGFGAFASLNFVEKTFTLKSTGAPPPVIPEPMSLTLLPLALAGLGLRKKFAR